MEIYFIYAAGCEKCEEMRTLLNRFKPKKCVIVDMECDTDEAVDYAVDNNINDIPACNIGGTIIQGESFTQDDIHCAFKEWTKQ